MKYNRLITGFLEAIKKNKKDEEIKNFEIKNSNIHGKGVFAKKRIKPGEFINVALFKGKSGDHDTTALPGFRQRREWLAFAMAQAYRSGHTHWNKLVSISV